MQHSAVLSALRQSLDMIQASHWEHEQRRRVEQAHSHLRTDSIIIAGEKCSRWHRAKWSASTVTLCTTDAVNIDTSARKKIATPFTSMRASTEDTPKTVTEMTQRHRKGVSVSHGCTEAHQLGQFSLDISIKEQLLGHSGVLFLMSKLIAFLYHRLNRIFIVSVAVSATSPRISMKTD